MLTMYLDFSFAYLFVEIYKFALLVKNDTSLKSC